jgi:hypothetical protein
MTNSTGDTFSNISGSTIINRSTIDGAVNTLSQAGSTDAARAMEELGQLVAESGNTEAGELYEALSEEIQKPQPKQSLMRSYWEAIQAALPLAANAATITGVIDKLVGG